MGVEISEDFGRNGRAPEPSPWPDHEVVDDADGVDEAAPRRTVRITWANTIEPAPVVWAWREPDQPSGRIPSGSLSIAAGREGTGKSSFGIWLAAKITRGTLPGAFHGKPRRVFYLAVEDSWKHTLVPRLMAAGADLARVGRLDVITDDGQEVTLSLPSDNSLLEREAIRHGVALIVIDPLMSVIGEKIDTHREREVRLALDPLAKLADKTAAIVLGIAHFNKSNGTDTASLITGSGAFKNVPRTVFGFAKDDESGNRVMSQVKNSLGREDLPSLEYTITSEFIDTPTGVADTSRFEWIGETDRSVADVLRAAGREDDADEKREIDAWLIEYLTAEGGTSNARDVIRDGRTSGFTEDALKKARRRVKATTSRQGFGKGSTVTWTIDAAIGAIGAEEQKLAPMAPMGAPMESDRVTRGGEEPSQEPEEPMNQKVSSSGSSLGSSGSEHAPQGPGNGHSPFPGDGGGTVGGRSSVAPSEPAEEHPLTACRACLQPLDDVDGIGLHPNCSEPAEVAR